jgi:hypothetical protein
MLWNALITSVLATSTAITVLVIGVDMTVVDMMLSPRSYRPSFNPSLYSYTYYFFKF